ncbi:MAG: AraC family transcriptional regulator [Verrucomicrobia bacterium]|nr:MAG: AraC family transcriptional regulator [Verrucomicrobiota bacterium]
MVETMNTNGNLIEKLSSSKIYQDYERAFSETTGLPVSLRPVESWQLPHRGKRKENPFCARMSEQNGSCAACLRAQQKLSEGATQEAQTMTCSVGLCDTAVPIRVGDRLIGFLQTGQVFRKKPTTTQFDRAAKWLAQWGLGDELSELRKAYFETRVLSPKEHAAVVKLLEIFAQHLAVASNQIIVQQENAELPVVTRAKEYILQHQEDDLSLGQVAKAVNTSTFYFCKLFKKVTGINFTQYLSRVRIEKAKNLLLNPNLRVSEIAYQVGFQSLTHFNRVFKKVIGESPTEYRAQLSSA